MMSPVANKIFCNRKISEAPVNDHRAIGLVELFIQTIKCSLACLKKEKEATNPFNTKLVLKSVIYQLLICKLMTTNTSPFRAVSGKKTKTTLIYISMNTKPKSSNLFNIKSFFNCKHSYARRNSS